jgi:translation initiation factor IF-3
VRLVAPDGSQIGVRSIEEAQWLASQLGLDVVEVAPEANPPVCRLMDYGKFKYEQKKQANQARKRQTVIEVKEIKFRPKTDDHDYDFKMRHIHRFLAEGNKAKVTVRFRGRELAHPQVAQRLLERIVNDLKEDAVLEQASRMEGRTMFLLLAPKSAAMVKPAGPAVPGAPTPRPLGPPPPRPSALPAASPGDKDEEDEDEEDKDEEDEE